MPEISKLVFREAPEVPIAWERVRTFRDAGGLSGYVKVTLDHVDLNGHRVYHVDPQGKSRFGRRPFADDTLRDEIRFVVFHHSVTADTATTERVLRTRGLSVHFGVDADGTIHQLLDLSVRDTSSEAANDRGIGVEVANVVEPYGAYTWQRPPPGYEGRQVVGGQSQHAMHTMFAYTDEQRRACAALAAALCVYFPRMAPDTPEGLDSSRAGACLRGTTFGVLGHAHVTSGGKWDPGPAFDFALCRLAARARVAVALGPLASMAGQGPALAMQRALQALGYRLPSFGADGDFGDESRAALRAFQTDHGLPASDGVDAATLGAMEAGLSAVIAEARAARVL